MRVDFFNSTLKKNILNRLKILININFYLRVNSNNDKYTSG